MKRYKKILVPVDGSKMSKMAFEQALELAKITEGEIKVVHVLEPHLGMVDPFEPSHMPTGEGVNIDEKGDIAEMLHKYVHLGEEAGVQITSEVLIGHTADEIVKESSNHDLVIIGSMGHGAVASFFLGSNAEKVSRHACCPVMLVREIGRECKI